RLGVVGDGVVVFVFLGVGHAAVVVGGGEAGVEPDGRVEVGDGLVEVALVGVGVAAVEIGLGAVGGEGDGLVEVGDGLFVLAAVGEGEAAVEIGVSVGNVFVHGGSTSTKGRQAGRSGPPGPASCRGRRRSDWTDAAERIG